ncbi:MAG: hypothetical protein JWM19_6464 [Actinomycetia bacterium]|nr:hypothetical protein [Actinomycetes bacterium]
MPGLAGTQHLAEGLKPRPAGEFRQRLAEGAADHVTPAEQPAIAIGEEFEDQVGPGHVGHGGRQAGEHFPQRPESAGARTSRLIPS